MSDNNWLKIALQLTGNGGAQPLDPQQQLADTTGYWVHLDYTREESEQWLQNEAVPQAVIDALTAAETRPRASEVAGGVLVYLRGVNLNPGARPEDMIALRMWVSPGGLISTQKRTLLSVEAVRKTLDSQQGPESISALVAELIDQLIWRMEEVIENLELEVEACAQQLEESPTASLTSHLSLLRRRAITLRRYLAPQREALIKLQNESLFAAADTLLIREATDRLQRLLEDLDAAREHATLLQEEVFSVQNEAINDRMYLLAIISALFLPLGFLTGLFGINVGGLPGVEDPNAFWWFCSGVAVIALGVGVWMRKRRWL
ncbi:MULTISPECIES: zinc transporter ZntB [unclassified Alcanivorax]|jgi:zinc transporter|uniref:zinc transporter ZntB n=1 Tax=unclassified Alcanivorax TaxID=2638842 RepID=UPI0007B95DD3|nr:MULTISPECIES: zinc transporter ZntB [unclassified Alcanivorax]KZX76601.1 magnesium transporter [Alcanivorax sp. HI0013]KZX81569.1 magnesium transporter [Alcanivorax sp. HI0011]KZY16163.1 magnesium transporter [Alcanivorax sp. HI0035]MED5239085.1 zinc transporter ZntB [Pseudomonadota bacterium]KZX63779.1 magnesium transporter [Alcanivorax sp. HI0003]